MSWNNSGWLPGIARTAIGAGPGQARRSPSRLNSALLVTLASAVVLSVWPLTARAQLELRPSPEPPQVFGGEKQTLTLIWHNTNQFSFEREVSVRLFQASSATAVPLGVQPWKRLELLPGQTVIEPASLGFPAVKAETRFVLQWLAGTNEVLATSDVLAYPTNLLHELMLLAGDEPIGVIDPQDTLKPTLKRAGVEFTDFEVAGEDDYRGKLVIAVPFQNQAQMRNGPATHLKALAAKGAAVVWIQPLPEPGRRHPQPLKPSFYIVREGKGTIVVAQPHLVNALDLSPQSQLNLIEFARLALHPEALGLPSLTTEP
jgi:hypothetical protein